MLFRALTLCVVLCLMGGFNILFVRGMFAWYVSYQQVVLCAGGAGLPRHCGRGGWRRWAGQSQVSMHLTPPSEVNMDMHCIAVDVTWASLLPYDARGAGSLHTGWP
jgi:predicted flavoprotein YhiN